MSWHECAVLVVHEGVLLTLVEAHAARSCGAMGLNCTSVTLTKWRCTVGL